jgi:hypothetical protein
MSRTAVFALLVAASAVSSCPASARVGDAQHRPETFQAVLDCRGVADNAARLACYDAAASKMVQAESKGEIVVIDRAQARQAHREAFGLPLPSLDFVTRALAPEEVDQVQDVVRAARADPSGRWTMTLEGGAVWRMIDGELPRAPHAGSTVRIRRGSLGSFLMNVDNQHAVKVHRDL